MNYCFPFWRFISLLITLHIVRLGNMIFLVVALDIFSTTFTSNLDEFSRSWPLSCILFVCWWELLPHMVRMDFPSLAGAMVKSCALSKAAE